MLIMFFNDVWSCLLRVLCNSGFIIIEYIFKVVVIINVWVCKMVNLLFFVNRIVNGSGI